MILDARQLFDRYVGICDDIPCRGDKSDAGIPYFGQVYDRHLASFRIRKSLCGKEEMHRIGPLLEFVHESVLEERFCLEARNRSNRGNDDDGEEKICESYLGLDAFHG